MRGWDYNVGYHVCIRLSLYHSLIIFFVVLKISTNFIYFYYLLYSYVRSGGSTSGRAMVPVWRSEDYFTWQAPFSTEPFCWPLLSNFLFI